MKFLSTFLFLSLSFAHAEDTSSMVGGVKGGDIQTSNIGTGSGFGYYPVNKRQQQQSEKPLKTKKPKKKNLRLKQIL